MLELMKRAGKLCNRYLTITIKEYLHKRDYKLLIVKDNTVTATIRSSDWFA
jgi:hypothetical protein